MVSYGDGTPLQLLLGTATDL